MFSTKIILPLIVLVIILWLINYYKIDESLPDARIYSKTQADFNVINCIYDCKDNVECLKNC